MTAPRNDNARGQAGEVGKAKAAERSDSTGTGSTCKRDLFGGRSA